MKRLTLYLNNPFLFTIELFSISGRFKATFFFFVKYFLSALKGFEIIVTTCDSDFKRFIRKFEGFKYRPRRLNIIECFSEKQNLRTCRLG